MSIKKDHLVLIVSLTVLIFVGVGTVEAIKFLGKEESIKLKQEMAPKITEKAIKSVGIYAPIFEIEMNEAKSMYVEEYGEEGFEVLKYRDYTLLIPPFTKENSVLDAKAQVDAILLGNAKSRPNKEKQLSDISKIRKIFGIEDDIVYNDALGAYTDGKGFQYNFEKDELFSKQIGVTSALNAKFEKSYPHFKPGFRRTTIFSRERAQIKADEILARMYAVDELNVLRSNIEFIDLGDARVGFIYGDKDVHVMIDQVTGDVISFNRRN